MNLDELADRLEQTAEKAQERRKNLHDRIGKKVLTHLQGNFGGSTRVSSWQENYTGSKGGYTAVRPKAKTKATDHKGRITKYQVGMVTNAVESGHDVRPAPKDAKERPDYRPRRKKERVDGLGYYAKSRQQAIRIARDEALGMAEEIAKELNE